MERAERRPRLRIILAAAVLGGTAWVWIDPAAALAQMKERVKPVRIVQIYGRDTLEIGEIETYRMRVNSPYAATYSWTISDGTALGGNPIVYRFAKPGHYTLVATAVNPTGKDLDTLEVFVRAKEPPPVALKEESVDKKKERADHGAEAPSPKPGPTSKAQAVGLKGNLELNGNYTWIIATYFQRSPAEALANAYRAVGFRSGVIVDSGGKGSTVFRVTLGQFDSEQKALEAKGEVMRNGVQNPLLHHVNGA